MADDLTPRILTVLMHVTERKTDQQLADETRSALAAAMRHVNDIMPTAKLEVHAATLTPEGDEHTRAAVTKGRAPWKI